MRFALFAALSASTLALAACGSSSTPSPFNGSWSCKDVSTLTFTEPTTYEETSNPTSTLVIDVPNNASITVQTAAIDGGTEGDGGVSCPITYDTTGSMAVLAPGQACPVTLVNGADTTHLTVTYTTGSASVTGTTLTYTLAGTFTGATSNAKGSLNLAGMGTSTVTCTN
jgi:hypothetical protein